MNGILNQSLQNIVLSSITLFLGFIFLLMAFLGRIGVTTVSHRDQRWMSIFGTVFLIFGIGLFIMPRTQSEPTIQSDLLPTDIGEVTTLTTPTPTKSNIVEEMVTLKANEQWKNTGIAISEGDIVKITYVSGRWRTSPDVAWSYGVNCTRSPCDDCLLSGAPEGNLIAKVGNGDAKCIANSSFISKDSGVLYLSFNDNIEWFHDNEGQLTVQVKTTKP